MNKIIAFLAILFTCIAPLAASAQEQVVEAGFTEVKIGYVPTLDVAPFYVLKENRWDRALKLILKPVPMRSTGYAKIIAEGKLDGFYIEPAELLKLNAQGVAISGVTMLTQDSYFMVATGALFGVANSPDFDFEHALLEFKYTQGRLPVVSLIEKGSQADIMFRYWLKREGIPLSQLKIVYQGIGATVKGFLENKVDAALLPHPYDLIVAARLRGEAGNVLRGSDLTSEDPYLPKGSSTGMILAFTNEFIEKNPQAVRRIIGLNHKGVDYAKEEPATVANFAHRYMGSSNAPPQIIEAALKQYGFLFNIDVNKSIEFATGLRKIMLESGEFTDLPAADSIYNTRLHNDVLYGK